MEASGIGDEGGTVVEHLHLSCESQVGMAVRERRGADSERDLLHGLDRLEVYDVTLGRMSNENMKE